MPDKIYEVIRPGRIVGGATGTGTIFTRKAPNPDVLVAGDLKGIHKAFRPHKEGEALAYESRTGLKLRTAKLTDVLLAQGCLKEIKQ